MVWELGAGNRPWLPNRNVYVRSERAAQDVMETLRRLLGQLRLRINEAKSAIAHPWERSFLGYTFFVTKKQEFRRGISVKALCAMKDWVRRITRRTGG